MKIKFEVDVLLTQFYEVDVNLNDLRAHVMSDDELDDLYYVEPAAKEWFEEHMDELTPTSQLLPGDEPITEEMMQERWELIGDGVRVSIVDPIAPVLEHFGLPIPGSVTKLIAKV